MMMKTTKTNRYISLLLCTAFVLFTFTPLFSVLASNKITIKTTEDYIDLTKKCKTDSWSRGKTVELADNLDLSNINFVPIPIFSGHFNGNGYTISGVNIVNKGSHQGLFRYIQNGAVVENLNVKGIVTPSGSAKYIGGIVGENNGTIINCSFDGDVSGESTVGGICGYVGESGIIRTSRSNGTVISKSYTGGICGQNFGRVDLCENYSSVNTTETETGKSLQDLSDIDVSDIRSSENVNTDTDTGGICGYLKGKITSCKNFGNIGYKSIGYNTGGICGRSAGYIVGCENQGEIRGRKDIGGICGQAEPYVQLEYSKDVLNDIKNTLADIRGTVNSGVDSESGFSDSLDGINNSLRNITDTMDILTDDVTDYTDDVISRTNDMTDRLHTALVSSDSVFTELSDGIKQMADGLEDFKATGDYIQSSIDKLADDLSGSVDMDDKAEESLNGALAYLRTASKQFSRALYQLQICVDSLNSGLQKLNTAMVHLEKALEERKNIEQSFAEIAQSISDVIDSIIDASNSLRDIAKILSDLKKQGYLKNIADSTIANIKALAENYKDIKKSLSEIRDALEVLSDQTTLKALSSSLDYFSRAFSSLAKAWEKMQDIIGRFDLSLEFKDATEEMDKAIDSFKDGCTKLENGASSLSSATDKLNSIVNNLSKGGAYTLPQISDSFNGNVDSLQASIRRMQGQFENLNGIMKDQKNKLTDNVHDITDQLELLADIMSDAYEDTVDADKDDFYEDISDIDKSSDTRGKTVNCQNTGVVNGDVNIGGVVGSMAIEYDFDPEDDVKTTGKKSVKFTYKTKCIVRNCTNSGEITAKKNYVGGIVGRMDLGSLIACDNYGKISSSDGNYIGGIAGKSDTIIRNSATKCELSGADYIGGIAGEASKIVNSQSLVYVDDHGEYAGAIAGSAEKEKLSRNYCISDTLGAIDDINYAGVAEETTIDNFARFVDNNFNKKVNFTLKFVADDKEIATLNYNYKDEIPDDEIPKIPEKRGYYGKWSDYDFKNVNHDATITAEYSRTMDILSSDLKRDGKSIILVCGSFDDAASVSVSKALENHAVDSYDVNIGGVYTDSYTVRYLPLSENKKADIYIDSGDGLKKVHAKEYGSYLEFEANTPVFKLCEMKKNYTPIIIYSAIGVIAAAAFLLFGVKKLKKLKAKK